jgi:hypothetical protein
MAQILAKLSPEQQAIRARCFHPGGAYSEFKKEEIEQSIPDRFVRNVFHVDLTVAALLANPTVAELAVAVVKGQTEQVDDETLGEVLAELAEISDDDAKMMLTEKNGVAIDYKSK